MISFLFYYLTNIFYFLYCLYKLVCFEDEWNSNYGTITSILFIYLLYNNCIFHRCVVDVLFISLLYFFLLGVTYCAIFFCFLSLLPYFDYWRAYAILFLDGVLLVYLCMCFLLFQTNFGFCGN